jgi:hypothetical protein
LCLSALALLSGPARGDEVVIDFEGLTHAGADPVYLKTWEQEGFRLTDSIDPVLQDSAFAAWGTGSPDFPGSTSLFAVFPSAITLERSDGARFDAFGISLAALSADFAVPATVVFTGQLAAGGSVTQVVTLSGAVTEQPFSFDASFASLVALRWRQSDAGPHQFDNIRLAVSAVPEPATALSAVWGLLLLAAWRSRAQLR